MDKTVYTVFHIYEVDGGFGDAVAQEDFVFATEDKEAAEGYVEKYNNPHVYSVPYDSLTCGELVIREIKTITPDLSVPPWKYADYWPLEDRPDKR